MRKYSIDNEPFTALYNANDCQHNSPDDTLKLMNGTC